MSASNSKGSGEVRGNPLFANTGGEKRKIRPPASDPTVEPVEPQTPVPAAIRRPPPPREMGEVRFDEFYVKRTMHFIPVLLEKFDALAKKQHKSKTRLFNEAIAGILASYGVLDEDGELLKVLRELGIEV